MKNNNIDKLFRDAAEKPDFLFSTGAWERVEAALDASADANAGIDIPFVKASKSYIPGNAAPSSSGFAQVLQQKSRIRRRALFFQIGSVAAASLLLISGAGYLSWENASTRIPDETFQNPETPYSIQEWKISVPPMERTPAQSLESTPNNSDAGRNGDVIIPEKANQLTRVNPPVDSTLESVPIESPIFVSEDSKEFLNRIALKRLSYAALPVQFAWPLFTQEMIHQPNIASDGGEPQLLLQSDDQHLFAPPVTRQVRKPVSKWSLVLAGRSMRLADVPEGFNISDYSPEFGVGYRLMDTHNWFVNAELSGYWVAGTLGKVTFARKVVGFGDAKEYRYISAEQVMQLELPVHFNWKLSPSQSVFVGVNQTYMLPTAITVEEERVDWFGIVEQSEKVETGYIYGMRRYNVALSAGVLADLWPSFGVHGGVSYYFLDRDLLDAEALAPIPWQLRFGIHYRI